MVRMMKKHRGRAVSVFIDGLTFQGTITDVTGDAVALQGVKALADGGQSVEMDDDVIVPFASIVWAAVRA